MSIRRLKQIRRHLTENENTHCRVDVLKALALLDEEIASQDRSKYFKKYYQENKETMRDSHNEWLRKKAEAENEASADNQEE